jgi:predicted porin
LVNGAAWEMASGYAQGNRWGLKGSEDLGGGTKAVFQLENGFDLSSGRLGQSGRMFGREGFASLSRRCDATPHSSTIVFSFSNA